MKDWLVSHISVSMEMSESNTKHNVIRVYELKIDNNMTIWNKTSNILDAFEGKYI